MDETECTVYPELRKHIKKILLFHKKHCDEYALYIKETDRVVLLPESTIDNILEMSALMDGKHSIDVLLKSDGSSTDKERTHTLALMHNLHLLDDSLDSKKFSEASVLSKKLCGLELHFSDKFAAAFGYLYWGILLSLAIVTSVACVLHIESIGNVLHGNIVSFNGINYFLSILFTIPLFIFHEFAHVATACRFGLHQKLTINVALYFHIIPYIYVKIPGIYTVKPSGRIAILISGICSNILLGIILLLFGIVIGSNVLLSIALSNVQIAIVNLIPFTLTDGYFILTNLLKKCNLRKKYLSFISNIGKSDKVVYDRVETAYLFISILYLELFLFIELKVYISTYFSNLSNVTQLLINLVLTIMLSVLYIAFVKIRINRMGDKTL